MQILDRIWAGNFRKLLKYQFLPFFASLMISISYLHYSLSQNSLEREEKLTQRVIYGTTTLALLTLQIMNEIEQMKGSESFREHFDSLWNKNDAIWLILSPIIVLASIPSNPWIEMENLVTLSSIATFSMLVKVFDWMRLFDQTSFYVLLIKEVVY